MGKKTKHNPPQKKPSFIKFSKVQVSYLNEVQFRQAREWNEALDSVYEELGIREKILQSPPKTYSLRQDFSGLDVLTTTAPKGDEKTETEKPPTKEETH